MKYMTADLLARSRSEEEPVAEEAAAQWEQACEAYREYVNTIQPKLPPSVRRLLRGPCLHDAKVLTIAVDKEPFVSLFLQRDDPRKTYLELQYRVLQFKAVRHPDLAEQGKPLQWWLYDEIELLQEDRFPVMQHSILLTGGWELQLTFLSLRRRPLQKVFFPAADSSAELMADELEPLLT